MRYTSQSIKVFCTLALCLILMAAKPAGSFAYDPTAQEQTYIDNFVTYFQGIGQIFPFVRTLDQYAQVSLFDAYYDATYNSDAVQVVVNQQNSQSNMAWGTAYYTEALNSMYRATRDTKYLQANLQMVSASLINRDSDKGYQTFFGESAPCWGTDAYAGRWVIHGVHTGNIAFGILECLRLVKQEPALMTQMGAQYQMLLDRAILAVDWHNRAWVEGPTADEGHYVFRDEIANVEGDTMPANQQGCLGKSLWTIWKINGSTAHRDKALKLARYLKRRTGLYSEGAQDIGAWFWNYEVRSSPYNNPRPWNERNAISGGEDFSHAALTASFPLLLARDGEVWTQEELHAYGNTVTRGFARMDTGVMFANVAGTHSLPPTNVQNVGHWFVVGLFDEEAYDRLVDFMVRYQARPNHLDLAYMIEFRPKAITTRVKQFELYK